ncbi:GerAB/ArcD/ProY family transporter [Oceanobacillus rekensis]|uniref:GerAB/ArcD/ProY family transporter n=1 Tax=Oceanobacillus rekensis TaxID=937927 RepID=UPI000B44177E|nr:endospore germination permease [Oceanobacillus rekensis]
MKTVKYEDEKIKSRDIMIAVPSMVISIGVLSYPKFLAESTIAADGWMTIILGGIIAVLYTWIVAKLAVSFPSQSFLSYASSLVSKPVAICLTLLFVSYGISLTAFEIRAIADISHQYLFERTPIEVIMLTFLLVVVYAVSGSRAGIFRLNTMFLPIIFAATLFLVFFSIGYMEVDNMLPMFKTDLQGHLQGTMDSSLSYTGVGILLFYISLVKDPKKAPGSAALGMSSAVIIYLVVYLTCIAVFGDVTTENIRFPFIELAKSVEIPGGFFERTESIFFVIWIMAIFTTTVMAFDVSVMALNSIFPNITKTKIIFFLSPFIFFLSMIPKDFLEMKTIANFLGYFGWGLTGTTVIILWAIYKLKGGKQNEK